MVFLAALSMLLFDPSTARFHAEADRLTQAMIVSFYDRKQTIWRPHVASAEAVGTQGYTFWPSLLAWQTAIEAAKVEPSVWKQQVAVYFDALEKYFDKSSHAYCAWTYFPGNDDKFYDDNAWAVIACLEAFETTHEPRFRARAMDVLDNFVKTGWDSTGKPGGLRWGTKAGISDRNDRTVSATAAGALAALLAAKTHDNAENRAWAKRALDWVRTRLSAPNGLIYDGFRSPGFERMDTIWTYNTGVPIRAAIEYARQTGDSSYKAWAIEMGNAALDRSQCPLFDSAATNPGNRYWFDGTYFVHYLVDGLRALSQDTGDQKYLEEARREADYCIKYLKDADGLYWRNMRLWKIDSTTESAFKSYTGQPGPALDPDASERQMDSTSLAKPVQERPMTKTLLANAGAARMFWLLSH